MGWFKKIIFVLFLLIVGILVFSYFRPGVVANLIVGNEMTISISADNKNLDLINGNSGQVNFDFSVLTSAFCKVNCDSKVIDLGKDAVLEEESFGITPLKSKDYRINLAASEAGVGKTFYRFEVSCVAEKSWICRDKGYERTRSLLIVVNRNFSKMEEQENIILQQRAVGILEKLHQINLTANEMRAAARQLNFGDLESESLEIVETAEADMSLSSAFSDLWKEQKYAVLNTQVAAMEVSVIGLQGGLDNAKKELDSRIIAYNNLADNLEQIRERLDLVGTGSENVTFAVSIFNFILNDNGSVNNRINVSNSLKKDLDSINLSNSFSDVAVDSRKLIKIDVNYSKYDGSLISLDLGAPLSKCCLFNQCMSCCEQCSSDKDKYPVILLHGHDFSRDASAEYALDDMDGLQKKLEGDGYLNAGALLATEADSGKGSLAGPWPITVKSSYYFDIYKESENSRVMQTKTDNIDTYAIRLRDIVEVTKSKTNKEKVNIVAHSMGGLVVRRYLQVFGSGSTDKVIVIATPNHGIDGDILKYCYLFGEKQECGDMDSTSLLISKLNNGVSDKKIYNIIGDGCVMDDETGDGIVKFNSAYLEGAENVAVDGACGGSFDYFHVSIVDFSKYPEVYNLIRDYLKSE